jgi:hypothetical protein
LVTNEKFVERKNGLCQLARRDTNNKKPLCMLITGTTGAGKCKFRSRRLHSKPKKISIRFEKKKIEKAKILESLVSYAKQFSQNVGHEFNDQSILLTAIRGAAPTEIADRTSASVFGYMRKTKYAKTEDINFFKDTRLSVIDEISFAAYQSTLTKISENLKSFREVRERIYQSVSWATRYCEYIHARHAKKCQHDSLSRLK